MRPFSRRFLLAALAWAALAVPPAVSALDGGRPPVRLVAPRAGETLAAGATAELEWAPLASFSRLSRIDEWEAFLSLDGGATYPVRITPHLDQDLRRVRFQVPSVPVQDARILLRFGDERRETAVELPQRFAIAASPVMERGFLLDRVAPARGEPALPGHSGVVAWVEGTRRGGSLRRVVADEMPGLRERLNPPSTPPEAAVLASGPAPRQPPASAPGRRTVPSPAGGTSSRFRPDAGPPLSFDILLLTQRQNE